MADDQKKLREAEDKAREMRAEADQLVTEARLKAGDLTLSDPAQKPVDEPRVDDEFTGRDNVEDPEAGPTETHVQRKTATAVTSADDTAREAEEVRKPGGQADPDARRSGRSSSDKS